MIFFQVSSALGALVPSIYFWCNKNIKMFGLKIYYLETYFIRELSLTLLKIGSILWDALRKIELFQFRVTTP